MIQDISPKQYHVDFRPDQPGPEDRCLVFHGRELLENFQGGKLCLPTYAQLAPYAAGTPRYLFRIDDTAYYLAELKGEAVPRGFGWWHMQNNRKMRTQDLLFCESTAYQLAQWYQNNRFCGRCGVETKDDEKERMLRCPKCGNLIYPKIAPAVIVAVTHGDRILMTRYQGREYKGYALIAGFTEIGETPEDTVRREVMEEVGLEVKDIRYYGSQPWGIESDLLLGFFVHLDGGAEIHLDREELAQAGWYRREEIDLAPDNYSLTNDMIQAFRRGDWD